MWPFFRPMCMNVLERRAVDAVVGNIPYPRFQLFSKDIEAASLPSAEKVLANIADSVFDFALGLRTISTTSPWRKAPIGRKVSKQWVKPIFVPLIDTKWSAPLS